MGSCVPQARCSAVCPTPDPPPKTGREKQAQRRVDRDLWNKAVEWTDIGIVLGARRHGEANAVAELMTREHGRHLGLVRGGAGSRLKPVLQAGNRVSATWRARLDEHLGYYVVEAIDLRAAALPVGAHALYGLNHLAALCRLLPERDPHAPVFDLLDDTIARLGKPAAGGGAGRPVRAAIARRARFRSRSRGLRGHRERRRSRLCLAEVGTRGVARRRRTLARPAAGAAGLPRRGRAGRALGRGARRRASRSPDSFSPAMSSSRAASRCRRPANTSSPR